MKDIYYTKYDIEYNNETGKGHGVILYDYAQFSGAEKSYQISAVGGRLGELVGVDDYKSNLVIQCIFGIISPQFMSHVTVLKRWLKGTGTLVISDHQNVFYKVWKVDYGDIERELRKFGQFTVSFTCTPYQFEKDGLIPVSDIDYNPYDLCRPIYTITGTGAFTLTVNGNEMTGTVNGSITIDTERMVSYNADGVSQNNIVTGNYEELYIPHGDVSVSVSGGTLSIIPQWGYDV
jgi:phage-related protein